MNKKALSLAISLALTIPTLTNALSLGDIESNSSLNQPFRGKINLHSTSATEAKTLKIRVASQAVFNRVGIDRPAFLNSIRFRTTVQNGKPVILVSSNQAINEPFLNFLLEVSWPNGKLLKEYTVLLDPPVLLRPDTAIASNNAGVRAEPLAQGRITRPAPRAPQMTQQQRVAQQRRQAQQQRQVQAQRRAQQSSARSGTRTESEAFAETARRVLGQQAQPRSTRRVASIGRTYRVRRGDTLSNVAKRLGYRSVRRDQMMVALFEKNRTAFSKNNMNNLKSGVLLKRPSLQEAKVLTAKQSKAQIIAQAREWKNARGQAVADNGSKSTASTTTKAPNTQQARMTVAGTSGSVNAGASGNGDIVKLNQQLTMTKESLTSKQKENEELKSRVTELQSLLRKKNRLITLKSDQLAKLQAAANVTPETANSPEAFEPDVTVAPAQTTTVDPSDIQTQIANDLARENGEIIRDGENQLAMTTQDSTPAVVEQMPEIEPVEPEPTPAETAPAATTPAESGTDILGLLSSPMVLGSGAVLGLLGIAGFLFMRRRKEDDFDFDSSDMDSIDIDTQMDDDDMAFADSPVDESEFVPHDEPSQISETVDRQIEHDGDEDILQEADVYIVYGLHDQAESELKQAIEKDPTNMAFRAKLLENYKAAGDVEAFEEETKAFLSIDSADKETYLDDIKSWGNSLNPANNLFSKSSMAAAGAGVAMVAGTASASDEVEALAENAIDDELDILEGLEMDELEDINLDDILSDDDGLIDNIDDVVLGLDDDITGGNFREITSDLETEIASVDDLLDGDDEIDPSEGLDLDFDTGLGDNSDTFETASEINLDDVSEESDLDLAKLKLDIEGDDFDKIMPEDNAYKNATKEVKKEVVEKSAEVASEMTDLDLDLDNEENLLADFDDNLSFLDLDDDTEVIEETQVETKLDLAKAYIDMGDIEGARSTLEEVMQDGSDDQKREAEELLENTG